MAEPAASELESTLPDTSQLEATVPVEQTERSEPTVRKITIFDADEITPAPLNEPQAAEERSEDKPLEAEAPVELTPPDLEPVQLQPTEGESPKPDEAVQLPEPEVLAVHPIHYETDTTAQPEAGSAESDKSYDDDDEDDYDEDEWDDDDEDEPLLPRRQRVLQGLRTALISTFALLAILVGAGLAYTYFMGGDGASIKTAPVAATVSTDPTAGMIKPHKLSPKAPESASIQMLTPSVKRGAAATLSVKTQPTSACTVIVDHNHIAYPVPTLKKQTADEFGSVNWDWTMPKTAPAGSSTVTVTCTYLKRSAVVQGDVVVTP